MLQVQKVVLFANYFLINAKKYCHFTQLSTLIVTRLSSVSTYVATLKFNKKHSTNNTTNDIECNKQHYILINKKPYKLTKNLVCTAKIIKLAIWQAQGRQIGDLAGARSPNWRFWKCKIFESIFFNSTRF